jgi:hypothetical protein
MVNNYDDFLNEGVSQKLKKLINNIRSYFDSEDDIEHLETELKGVLNKYKERLLKGDIKKIDDTIFDEIKQDFNRKLIEDLNLDTFFRGINNILLKKKEKKIEKYFDDYIHSIPTRLKTMYNAEKDIDITDVDTEDVYYDPYIEDEEFKEWRKVVATAPRFRVKRRRFEMEKSSIHIEMLKMRDWLATNNKKLVILTDGRDAAVKGSFIRSATENLHPSYFRVNTFGIPTEYEKEHWFERYEKVLPTTEQIA